MLAGEATGEGVGGEQRGMVLPFEPLALTFQASSEPSAAGCLQLVLHAECSQQLSFGSKALLPALVSRVRLTSIRSTFACLASHPLPTSTSRHVLMLKWCAGPVLLRGCASRHGEARCVRGRREQAHAAAAGQHQRRL